MTELEAREMSYGTRVVLMFDHPDYNDDLIYGDTGTFKGSFDGAFRPGIEWDKKIAGGHDCSETVKYGHGWYVPASWIEILHDEEDDFDDEQTYSEPDITTLLFGN